jgi:RHS repeat-associated protein
VRNPPGRPINDTTLNYTGQQLDGTNLLYYHARYYDPLLSRFVSPDTIVPGVESGKGGAAASVGAYQNHKLTVDYYEPNFISAVQKEHDLVLEKGFWFQLSGQERREVKDPWGPLNPQTLNRYAYVLNNPLRYVDPTGHDVGEFIQDYITDPIKRGWDTWSSWWNDPDFQDALATAPLPMGGVRKIPLGIGGRAGAVRGGARVAQVSRLFRGQVLARAMKVKVPYVGSTDIDLVLTGKRFVEVGGPSKGLTNDQLSKFGSQLTVLREYARQQGGEAYFYYARGTPQQVIEQAKRFLGPDNVLPIP